MKEYDDVYSLLTSLIKSESNVVCFSWWVVGGRWK